MITIFSGAGASKALNYPTTAEFFTLGKGSALREDPVYKNVSAHLKKQPIDVEDVLRLLSPFAILEKTPTGKFLLPYLSNNWIQTVPAFVRKTNEVCFDHYGRRPREQEVKKLYLPLLEFCRWGKERISIFTTNYDPVTDVLMEISEGSGIACHDGFNRFGMWDSGGYSELKLSGLAIYRLHGSMSWIEQDGNIRNTRDYSRRSPGYAEHLIIYPGFKGNLELEGHSAFRFAHTALKNELGETSVVVMIGFSFRDPYLNEIFRQALTTNQNLRLIVWNPIWPEGSDVGLTELKQEYNARIMHLKFPFGDDRAIGQLQELLTT
jgi:SIR2-like protein